MVVAGAATRAPAPLTVSRPGITAAPTAGLNRQADQVSGNGGDHDGSASAATAASILGSVLAARAARRDRAAARDAPRANENDAASAAPAAVDGRCVVPRSRSAAPAEHDPGHGDREEVSAEAPSQREVRIPGASALAADSAVAAASAARVFVVAARVSVGPSAARVAGRSARLAPVRVARPRCDDGARIQHPRRRSRDSFSLSAVVVVDCGAAVVGVAPAGVTRQEPAAGSAEAQTVETDGGAPEREGPRDVEGQDAAGGPVPGRGGQSRSECRRRVLRHSHDLISPLPLGAGPVRIGVGVQQPAARSRPLDRNGSSRQGHAPGRPDVLVEPRPVQARGSAGRVSRDAVPVGAAVCRLDRCVLDLDHEQQISRGDGGRGPPGGPEGQRGGAAGDRGGARVIGVDDAREDAGRAVLSGRGAHLCFSGVSRDSRDTKRSQPQARRFVPAPDHSVHRWANYKASYA